MSKGLEALKKIKDCVSWCAYDGKTVGSYKNDFKLIETELKRLEELEKEWEMEHTLRIRLENILYEKSEVLRIIKEKPMFPVYITMYKDAYEMVVDRKDFGINQSVEELQAEFDLLKEYFK